MSSVFVKAGSVSDFATFLFPTRIVSNDDVVLSVTYMCELFYC